MGICRSLMDSSQKRTVTWTFVVSSTNCQIANDLRYFNAHMTSLLCDVIWSQEVMEPFQYKDAVLPILRIPIINIRHSHNCLFFTMEIPMPGRMVFNIPPAQQSCWGVYWFHSVRLSVHPASRVRFVVPTVLVGSISYLYILSSNFRRCVACKVTHKIFKFEFLAIFLNL